MAPAAVWRASQTDYRLDIEKQSFKRSICILRMTANPDPLNAAWCISTQSAMVKSHPRRPKFFNTFELQGWVARVVFEQGEIFTRQILGWLWQRIQALPKI
jgi:hypothetical protein